MISGYEGSPDDHWMVKDLMTKIKATGNVNRKLRYSYLATQVREQIMLAQSTHEDSNAIDLLKNQMQA